MQTFVGPRCASDEQWEFIDDEDLLLSFCPEHDARMQAPPHGRILGSAEAGLGPLPSEEEASAATRLLQDSVHEYMSRAERVLEAEAAPCAADGVEAADVALSTARLVAAARANAASSRRALVTNALHLLTSDRNVQRVVRSLACDAAVWEAVSNNSEMQRFLSGPRQVAGTNGSRGQAEGLDAQGLPCSQPESAAEDVAGPRLHQLIRGLFQRLVDMRTSLFAVLARLFGLPADDRAEGEEGDSEQGHLMPGIVAVVVLVIAIIVLKRPILV